MKLTNYFGFVKEKMMLVYKRTRGFGPRHPRTVIALRNLGQRQIKKWAGDDDMKIPARENAKNYLKLAKLISNGKYALANNFLENMHRDPREHAYHELDPKIQRSVDGEN